MDRTGFCFAAPGAPLRSVRFHGPLEFHAELRRRVDEFFKRTGRWRRDCPLMYAKTAIHLTLFAGLYILLVFWAKTWWEAVPLSILLGLSVAVIGFVVQHDGGHQAYSSHKWINRLAAMSLDLIGGSSYAWHWKHVIFHHTYTNITDEDSDVDLGLLGRLTPHQKRLGFHRWQHLYLWPLYGFVAIKWQLFDHTHDIIVGKIGKHKIERPKGWDLVIFLGGRVVFFSLAFGIPMLFHPFWMVILFYCIASIFMGMVLSVVFQLAHCVEGTIFPMPIPDSRLIENAWAIHEVESTVDFARRNPIVAWLLGGLNFQIEHHLFPRICHVNYPALSKIVEQTCRDMGIRYMEHVTFWSGVAAHYRFLYRMGNFDDLPDSGV